MGTLMDYISSKYKTGEPIFISDIKIPKMTSDNLKQQLKRLVDAKKLVRFEKGIYYLPREGNLKYGSLLSSDDVAKSKYISRKGKIMGYYSGDTFAYQLGLSKKEPSKVEIVSNESAPIVRDISIGNKVFMVRRARIPITEDNYRILQLLDLLKDFEKYCPKPKKEVTELISGYVRNTNITRQKIDQYIDDYPLKVYKPIYDMRLDFVFK